MVIDECIFIVSSVTQPYWSYSMGEGCRGVGWPGSKLEKVDFQ